MPAPNEWDELILYALQLLEELQRAPRVTELSGAVRVDLSAAKVDRIVEEFGQLLARPAQQIHGCRKCFGS